MRSILIRMSTLFMASAVFPVAAQTVVYKCIRGSEVTYSNQPCATPAGSPPRAGTGTFTEMGATADDFRSAEDIQAEFERDMAQRERRRTENAEEEARAEARARATREAERIEREACAAELRGKPVVVNNGWNGGVHQVEQYLKRHLKDPDSFQAIEWSPVRRSCEGYAVRVKYRARNSFGGMVIEEKLFRLDTAGTVERVLGIDR